MKEKSFKKYIHSLLKSSQPSFQITKQGLAALDQMVRVLAEKIVDKAIYLNDKKTITSMEIVTALRLLSTQGISSHAISFANDKLIKFKSSMEKTEASKVEASRAESTVEEKTKPVSRESRCGLFFSVSAAERYVRKFDTVDINVSSSSAIYLAAVLEYICGYILEKTVTVTKEQNKVNITNRHIFLAISSDSSLEFIKKNGIVFLETGVEPENVDIKGSRRKSVVNKRCPGTKTASNIKNLQKGSDMLMQHAPFNRLVKEVVANTHSNVRYTKEFFYYLQSFCENKLIELMRNANKIATHSERETVYARDINLFLTLNKETLSEYKETGIPEASLRQMALRAGIRRYGECSSKVYRQYLVNLLHSLLTDILVCLDYHKVHTLSGKILIESLNVRGIHLAITYRKRKTTKRNEKSGVENTTIAHSLLETISDIESLAV